MEWERKDEIVRKKDEAMGIRKIYVDRLEDEIMEEDLRKCFARFGKVVETFRYLWSLWSHE